MRTTFQKSDTYDYITYNERIKLSTSLVTKKIKKKEEKKRNLDTKKSLTYFKRSRDCVILRFIHDTVSYRYISVFKRESPPRLPALSAI